MQHKSLYRTIADELRHRIHSGDLQPGDMLPTEGDLQTMYGVSRVTVRKALKVLVEQEIIQSVQGSGHYVNDRRQDQNIYQLIGFNEESHQLNRLSKNEVLTFQVMPAEPRIAKILELAEPERVYYVERLRLMDEQPVMLEKTWMPLSLFPDLSFDTMTQSKYHYVEQVKGLKIKKSLQALEPVNPDSETRELLNLPGDQPALKMYSTGVLDSGSFFEYSEIIFKTEGYRFSLVANRA